MKPVKLEIITEAKGDGFSDVSDDLNKTKREIEGLIGVQKQYIANIRTDLARLRKDFANSHDAEAMKPLAASISELESELKDAEFALGILEKSMNENATGSKTLRTQIRDLENEMANMTEGTEEYIRAMERLGELRDRQGDIARQGRIHGDDEKNIRATADAIAGLSGAMSAGVGIASLFGAEQEKLQQIQTRLQAVMATTIGLQQVAQTLNKDSYFSQILLTGVKKKWAAAQALLNTQLGIGVGLSKALMVSGIGLLLAGIAGLVALYNNWKKKQAEINALKQQFIDLEVDTAKAMAKSKVEAEQLHRIAKDQTKDYQVREKAINRLKSLMPEYNGHINREGVLVDNANTALKNYLVTLYKVEKAKKLIAGIEEKQGEIEAAEKTDPKSAGFWQKLWARMASSADQSGYLTYEGIVDDINKEYKKKKEEGVAKLREEKAAFEKELNEIVGDKTIFDALFGDDKKGGGSASSAPAIPDNKLTEQRLAAYRKIKEMEISIMADGEKKRKAQAELELNNKLAEIAREKAEREKHLKELAKAKVPISQEEISAISTQAQEQALLAKKQYDKQIQQIDRETANAHKAIQDEIRLNFETRLNRQLADIDAYHNDLMKKAGDNAALIAQIDSARVTEKQNARDFHALQQLDLEEQIALRRAEIWRGQLRLQAQMEEDSLRIQVSAAKNRLRKLQDLQKNGADVAGDIALVTAEIEALNGSLSQMPTKKLQELADYARQALGALGDFAGNFDEDLGGLFDIASGAVGGVSGLLSGNPQQMIQGTTQLLGTVGKLIKANKEANEEIRKFNLNLAQQAIDYSIAVIRAIKDVKSETDSIFTSNYSNTLSQGMGGYNAAIKEQAELMRQLGDATVKTGVKKKKFLGITYGTRDVYSGLLKQYPDLINKNGELNKELAETLLQSGNLSDETKNLVQNIIKAGEAADEAMRAVESELQNLVGSIGQDLKKVLDDAFASGTDSGIAMAEKIAEKLKDVSTAKLYNAVFGSLFADLEKRMKESYGATGDQNLTDDIDWFMTKYPQLIDSYNKGLAELQKRIKEAYGTDPFKDATGRTAVNKGIAQASQDSINEVNGRLTNIQGSLIVISERTVHIADLLFGVFEPLNRIADNTDRLEAIESATEKTREALEKIERDGINLKR